MNVKRGWILTVILLLTLVLAAAVLAEEAAEDVLTPHDVARIRSVREAVVSPDGNAVAYVLSVPRSPGEDEDGTAWNELHVVTADGTSTPYVTGEVSVGSLGWTSDSSKITFLTKRGEDEHRALWAIPLRGGEARRVLALSSDIGSYELCSDDRHVAVVGGEKEDKEEKKLREKGFDQNVFEEDLKRGHAWVAEIGEDGTAEEPEAPLAVDGHTVSATWSPGCDRLALKVAATPLVDDVLMQTRVRVVDLATSEIVAVENPGKLGAVAFSEDGWHLAILSAADLNDPSSGQLMTVASAGGELHDLFPGLEGRVRAIAWTSAKRIAYLVHEGADARLGEVDLDGKNDATLLARGGPIFTSISRAENGATALVGSTPSHPSEVFFLPAGASEAKRLTDSNPWLAEKRLATQEVVRYKARDGLELEGLLIRPLDEEAGKRHPLILIVHGGPESHYSNGWITTYSSPGQTGAARGFAAFYPNYRASTGRGVEFSKLNHGDPAGKEFDDLVDGVDHLIASGLVDRDKVAITGGSYGGYATAWGATYYSERFAAAVMMVGISEKIAKFGTSDIPNELFLVHERHWPWEDFQFALERSPVYYVDKARTPILIAHGQKDTRVFPGQSMILYRFLKTLGKTPVRLVFYPNEGHGNRRAAARLDYSLRQLRWIEHYLTGPGGSPPGGDPPEVDVDYALEDDEDDADDEEGNDRAAIRDGGSR